MSYRLLLLPVFLLVRAAIAQPGDFTRRAPANAIDSLHTQEEVLAFIRNLYRYNRDITISLDKPLPKGHFTQKTIRDFGALPYEKADFDGNGYTDLLFNGYEYQAGHGLPLSFIVLSFGGDSLRMVGRYHSNFFAGRTVHVGRQVGIRTLKLTGIDTLVWFQDVGFIEKVKAYKHHIGEIRYEFHNGGLSGDGVLQMTIYGDSVKLIKEADISPETRIDSGGFFIARLDTASHRRLYALLEHLDFPHLKKNYHMGGWDHSVADLEISYDDGKKATITDDGLMGTWGLLALHSVLLQLEGGLTWTKAD